MRSSICGWPTSDSRDCRRVRVAGQSSAWVSGEAASPAAVACSSTRPSARPACSQAYAVVAVGAHQHDGRPLDLRRRRVGVAGRRGSVLLALADHEVADQPVRRAGVRVPAGHRLDRDAVDGRRVGAHPALQLGEVGGVALLHLLGPGDEEDGRDLLLGAGDRLEPGAEGRRPRACSRSSSSAGTARGWNGVAHGVPALDRRRQRAVLVRWLARAGDRDGGEVVGVGVVGQQVDRRRSCPAAASATTANSTAMPQLMICCRPVGSSTGRARSRSRKTSSRSGPAANRHGWVLWIDGARVAAATTCAQSCSLHAEPPCRRPPRGASVLPTPCARADPRPSTRRRRTPDQVPPRCRRDGRTGLLRHRHRRARRARRRDSATPARHTAPPTSASAGGTSSSSSQPSRITSGGTR